MKKFYPLILFLITILSCSKSPEKLKQESDRFFNQALDYYERGYLNQSAELFEKVIDIEDRLGNNQRKGNCYIYLGLIGYQVSNFSAAKNYYKKALEIFSSLNDKKNELLVMNNIAGINSNLGEYEEAIKIYSEVIGKSLIFADKEAEAIASLNLGELYKEIWNFEKSFEYFNRAYDSYEILGNAKYKIYTLNKIGELFILSKNYESALKSFEMAFEIINKSGENYLIQEIYNNIGLIYFYEGQISKAREFFEIALNSIKSTESNQHILISLKNNLGDCEFSNQVYSKAILQYKEALDLSEKSFLKFLSPIIQLKIARAFEQLYFINGQESDKKSAERFYQFAVNRFEENNDWKNLQVALTSITSFYYRSGDAKNSIKYFQRLKELKLLIDLKPDDNLRTFAIKPDYDLSFLPLLINQNRVYECFKFIENLKFQKAIEYFLRFQKFSFLKNELSHKMENLKKEILLLNTYQGIYTQEISLPSSQRLKEKLNLASENIEEAKKRKNELLESLSEHYDFLKFLISDKNSFKFSGDKRKIYVGLFPVDQNLIFFFISDKGLTAKTFKMNTENLRFNLKMLERNLETFTFDEIKNYSALNFTQIADEILNEIYSNQTDKKEIVYILNGSEIDFLFHLFFSKKYNQFLCEKFDVSYCYFLSKGNLSKDINTIALLKDGELSSSDDLSKIQSKRELTLSPEKKQKQIDRNLKIGLREKTKSKEFKNPDGIIVFDDLVLNLSSPELVYFEKKTKQKQSRFYLRDLMSHQPDFIFLKSLKSDETKELSLFLSISGFSETTLIISPLPKISTEITENFLYNYIKSVENKNLSTGAKEFFSQLKNEPKRNSKNEFLWIKFIN